MTGPAIASRVVGTIRTTAESHRGRVDRNVMIALSLPALDVQPATSAARIAAAVRRALGHGNRPYSSDL